MGDQDEIIELNSSPTIKPRRRHIVTTSESDPNRSSPQPTKDANTLLFPRSRSSTTILLTTTPNRSSNNNNNNGGGGGDGAVATAASKGAAAAAAGGRQAKIAHRRSSSTTGWGWSELRSLPLWQCSLAEFVATLLFTFFTICATIAAQRAAFSQPRLALAAAQGAAYSLAVFATAPLSGAHLNPALSLAALLTAHISAARALLYAASQLLGATLAALLVKLALPANSASGFFLGGCLLRQTVLDAATGSVSVVGPPDGAALAAEIFFSLAFVASAFALFVAAFAPRAGAPPDLGCGGAAGALGRLTLGAVFAGLALALLVLVSGQLLAPGYTSAGMNPARCFGPAVALGGAALWQQQWVFWLGPVLAAILFALFYRALFYAAALPPPPEAPATATPPPPPSAAPPPKQRKMDVFLHIKATLQNKPGAEEGGAEVATGMVHRKLEIAPFSPASSGMDVEGGYGASASPPPATEAEAGLLEAAEASTSREAQVILEHADLSLRNLMDIIPEDRRHSNHGFPTTIEDDDDDRYKL